ncbi:hypothetical protein Tco_0533623 [Tanacetum coccineum]
MLSIQKLIRRMQNYTRYDAQSFYDAMIFNMDSLGKYMLELILHQQRTPQLLKQKNVDSLKVDLVVIQDTCSEKEDSNSETASSKLVKECSLNFETKDVHAIKYKMTKAKERCMAYFRSLHVTLQSSFKRFTMLLNVDQLQKQLDKDEFQEDGSMAAFWVVNNQFQKFIDSKFTLDYDSQMTDTYFVEYTGLEVQHFRDTLLQHLGNVKKSVAKRTRHQRQYERRVNKRQMQTQESKIDTGKALDADLVDTESIRTDSTVQDDSSRSGNDTDADDADIRPIYDEEGFFLCGEGVLGGNAEVQLTAECNIFAIGQQHTEQPEIIVEGRVDQSKTTEQTTSLLANNAELKAQIQEKVFAIAALKNDLRKLKGNSVDTKFDKTSVLGKPVLPSLRNQSVVRQPNAFKSARTQMSKQRFASQVDLNKNLSKPVTQYYLPKKTESTFAKPDHMIASSSSRNSSKNMPRFSSNDMVHNHYLDVAKKKIQERDRNSTTSVPTSARIQTTTDDRKPNPRSNNQTSRSLPEVNSRAKIQSNKTTNSNKPVDQKSHTQKPSRQIFTGHRFSPNKTSAVSEKTSPRSDLRWKPTGRIFKSVGLRWIPTGKLFDSCTSKVDSEPPHGSNVDIPHIHECKQTLDSMVAEKDDISETIVKVDSQMMIQKNDVCSQQFRPRSSMSNDGRMPTKIELTLEQSQQGVSNDVLVSIEGVEELKRNVWIKGEKKEALLTP